MAISLALSPPSIAAFIPSAAPTPGVNKETVNVELLRWLGTGIWDEMQTNYIQSAQIPSFPLHSQTNVMLMSTKQLK